MDGLLELLTPDAITTMTNTFKSLSTQLNTGLTLVVAPAFSVFAFKFIWGVGKKFFSSLAK